MRLLWDVFCTQPEAPCASDFCLKPVCLDDSTAGTNLDISVGFVDIFLLKWDILNDHNQELKTNSFFGMFGLLSIYHLPLQTWLLMHDVLFINGTNIKYCSTGTQHSAAF